MIELTDREKVAIAAAASVSVMIGIWIGVWSVPVEGLSVPTDTHVDSTGATHLTPAYRPVPTSLPIMTVLLPAISVYSAYQIWIVDDETQPADGELGEEVTADD